MNKKHHIASKVIQILLIGILAASLGAIIPYKPITGLAVIGFLGLLFYMRIVLIDYHIILGAIILAIPFNFETLLLLINIPYLNPFNLLWISYVGIILLRTAVNSEPILMNSPLNLPLFLVIISFSISFVQSAFLTNSAQFKDHIFPTFQQWLQWILIYFFCLKGIRNSKEARQVIVLVIGVLLFAGIQNIRDYIGMMAVHKGDTLERAAGLFSNANYSASFFAYYVPVAVSLSLANLESIKLRLFFTVTAGVGLIAVVVTYSRGGIASVGIACLVIAFFLRRNISLKLVIILMLLISLALSSDNIRKRFSETSQAGPYGEVVDPSVQARLIAWSKAFHLIKERPLLGHGFFTFRYIKVEQFEDDAAKAHGSGGMAVHNGFLNILVNAGITGFLAYSFLLLAAMRLTLSVFRRADSNFWRGVGLGLFASLISLIFINMSGTRLYDRQMIAYLWILLAALYKGHTCDSALEQVDNS